MLIYGEFFYRVENRILMRLLSRLTSHLLESKKVVARRKFQNPRNPWLKIATTTQLYFCYSLVVVTSSFHLRECGSQVPWFSRFGNSSGKIIPSLIRGVQMISEKKHKGFQHISLNPPPPPSENPIIVKHIASLINCYTLIFKSNL